MHDSLLAVSACRTFQADLQSYSTECAHSACCVCVFWSGDDVTSLMCQLLSHFPYSRRESRSKHSTCPALASVFGRPEITI